MKKEKTNNVLAKKLRLKKNGLLYELYKNRILTIMILPAILYVSIFNYIPMAGIVLAFKNFMYDKGVFGSDWVGFNNFKFFFKSGDALRVTTNTITYNIAFMVVGLILQVGVAIILSEIAGKYFKKITQSLILLPYFISWVVAGAIVYNMFSFDMGSFNNLLTSLGLQKVDLLNNPKAWPYLFIIFNAWKGLGYGSVVYLAAITGIDAEIYEAAEIDGANIFHRITKITLPCLKPTIITLVLLALGNIVKGDFGMFYNLTGNNPLLYKASDIVDTFVYRSLMQNQDFGMAAAAGLYQSAIGFVIIMTVNKIVKKLQPEYALF